MTISSADRPQTNGVLAVTASQTAGNGTKPVAARAALKLKVIIRRLAAGLTEAEFVSILGDDWSVGQGKVDWFVYKPGKDSKDASKPSRPSRAYLHLTAEAHLATLSDIVRQSPFEDAQNTFTSPCLIGPPAVEFAPYGRTPASRKRDDVRAGTIDQDPEFMAFLEELANPTSGKDGETIAENGFTKPEKVTMTPLVQAIKDKKASKNKEAAAKAAKKHETIVPKGKPGKETLASDDLKKKGKDGKTIVDKAAKEAVKILNREAASKLGSGVAATTGNSSAADAAAARKLDLGKVPGRQRQAVVAAHIRMLQRDLGLSPAQAHRQVRRDTADAQKAEKAAVAEKAGSDSKETTSTSRPQSAQSAPVAPKAILNQANNRQARGKMSAVEASKPVAAAPAPMVLLKKAEGQQPASSSTQQTARPPPTPPAVVVRRPQQVAIPSAGATQAFVKHANPSQGVTEALLKEAMEKFGAVAMVEIDRRKGFAYVDFADTEGLKKAMAANPISVAQGTVQVMQRKGTALPPVQKPLNPPPNIPLRGGRAGRGGTIGRRGGGGRGGARGGGNSEAGKAPASTPTGPAK